MTVTEVIVFSKPDIQCRPCWATKKRMNDKGVPYISRDVTVDEEARDFVVKAGFLQTPVVIVKFDDDSEETWTGFDPDRIDVLASKFAA